MRDLLPWLRAEITRLWTPPDAYLIDAGLSAETWIAKVRLGLVALLVANPLVNLIVAAPGTRGPHYVSVAVTLFAALIALVASLALERGIRRPWVPMASVLLDVSLVSFALLALGVLGEPIRAVNNRIAFELYFLAIAGTCLRYDFRLTVIAGGTAFLQYLIIVLWAGAHDLDSIRWAPWPYGRFAWIDQLSRLILLAVMTGICAAVVVRLQRLRQESNTDRLTGLFNRAYLEEFLNAEIRRSKRYLRSFAVAMIDIDHFKRFNDTYGHATGDVALRTVAAILQREVRRSDLVARYGGEEMVVVMPETTLNAARSRIEAIRQAVAEEAIKVPRREDRVRITVSAGVSCWPTDGDNTDDLVHIADARLYHAKALGRNRVVSSSVAAASV